jgi:ubiquinone biosynthesis protein
MMARAIERSVPESKLYAPVRLVAEFERAITAELDFNLEADNAVRFTRNFEGDNLVKFPTVYKEASSKRVLTIEYSARVENLRCGGAGLQRGEDFEERRARDREADFRGRVFSRRSASGECAHPRASKSEPTLGLIDLGLVGRLTPQMRDRVIDLMVAVAREDRRAVADALYAIGRPTKRIDREAFEAEVSTLADKYLGKKLAEIEIAALFRDLGGAAIKYEIEVPPDFLMVGKTIMTVEGVGKEIYPELDVFEEVKPYFLKLFWQRYSPEKVSAELMRLGSRIGVAAADLPVQLQDVMEDLRRGNLVVRTHETSTTDAFDHLGRRLYSGLVVASFVIGAAIVATQKQYWIAGLSLAFAAMWGSGHISLLWLTRKRRKS